MDTEIPKASIRRNSAIQVGKVILILIVLTGGFLLIRKLLTPSGARNAFRIVQVEQGPVINTINANGIVLPSFELQLNAPINTEIKRVFLTTGATVQNGDIILELDDTSIRLEHEQLRDELEVRKNNVTKLKLEYDKNLRDLELEDSIMALQLSSLRAQLADMQRLKEVGGATSEEVEKAQLDLQINQLQKKKLENDLQFRKESMNSDKANLELEVRIQEKKLRELGTKLNKTQVISPDRGVITWVNEDLGTKVNEGEPLVRLAKLNSFKVEANASDRFLPRLREGSPVEVRINQKKLKGIIYAILPAVENNSIEFQIQLEDPTHPDLRPNMRVDVYVITDEKTDAIRVVNGPVFTGAKTQDIFVVEGDVARKREVSIGIRSRDYTEILSGLSAGEQVIVSDMTSYKNADIINLKGE